MQAFKLWRAPYSNNPAIIQHSQATRMQRRMKKNSVWLLAASVCVHMQSNRRASLDSIFELIVQIKLIS